MFNSTYEIETETNINKNMFIIAPKQKLVGSVLGFNQSDISANRKIGYDQTIEMIKNGFFNSMC